MEFAKKSLIFGLMFLPFIGFAYVNPGKPAGFVNDFANLLGPEEKSHLETKLSDFAKSTGNEIAVATVPDLGGDTIENFAVKIFEDWGIGKKGKDNGILILVSRDTHDVRIEVGYGLEGALTDAQSYWIIQNEMLPAFKTGDFYGGLDAATGKIMAAIGGEQIPVANETSQTSTGRFFFDLFVFAGFWLIWLAAILGRSKSWWAGGVIGGIIGIVVLILKGIFFGLIAIVVLAPFGLLVDFWASRAYEMSKRKGVRPPWWLGGGGIGGSHGGGFGGFGGGHSGGGGASSHW